MSGTVMSPMGGTWLTALIVNWALYSRSPYLGRGDVLPPFDMQQSQDAVGVCVNVVKTRGHPALLVAEDGAKNKVQS